MAIGIAEKVGTVFRKRIESGAMKVGDPFPSIRDVAKEQNIAYLTAVRVVEQLFTDGYIERVHRRLTVVRGVPRKTLQIGLVYDLEAVESDHYHPGTVRNFYAFSQAHIQRGHRLELLPVRHDEFDPVLAFAKNLKGTHGGGVIFLGRAGATSNIDVVTVGLREQNVPVVQWGRALNGMGEMWPVVTTDFAAMARQAVEQFYKLGRRRIGAIVGPWEHLGGPYTMLEGLAEGARDAGIAWDASHAEAVTDWDVNCGRQATEKLLARGDFDAILCADDIIAQGAVQVIAERGKRVPDDIAVIGAGDLLPPDVGVSLSTFELGLHQGAAEAVKLIEAQHRGVLLAGHRMVIPPRYIARDSCPDSASA